jgi:16S rRNA (adenine1518-N6/adenine1519-N6)-dimethyltransferase
MKPKKHLGQHFLTAPVYAKKIAEAVPADADAHLLEIGPGQGALSRFLKKRFPRFHLVEIDDAAIEILSGKLGDGGYTIHHEDVMRFDFLKAGTPLHVVGNLPYSIGARIIKKTLLYGNRIVSCTFMVQREVAERIVSAPHSKKYGFLSVFCSFFGTPRLLFHIPPGAFFPRPKVDSSVFSLTLGGHIECKLPREKWKPFFELVSRGFQQRRKKVINALSDSTENKEMLASVLSTTGIASGVRAEDLSCDQWLELYKRI